MQSQSMLVIDDFARWTKKWQAKRISDWGESLIHASIAYSVANVAIVRPDGKLHRKFSPQG